jgi:predicted nucleotidyltransferase
MQKLVKTASELQVFFENRQWKFCFIGGLALQFWGELRITRDVDLTLLTGFGDEEPFIDALLSRFQPRIADAKTFALRNRVVLLISDNEIGIDVSLGAFPFEESMVERADYQEYLPDIKIKICSPEDLIVSKAFADRDKDWFDIKSILIRQKNLDWNYIYEQLQPLVELKEEPEIISKLRKFEKEYH